MKKGYIIELGISAALCVLLVGGLLFFSSSIKSLARKIESARQELGRRWGILVTVSELKSSYSKDVEGYVKVMESIVPEKDKLIDLPKEIQSLAARQNLEFGFAITGETPAAPPAFGAVHMNLNLKGKASDLLRFLETLQTFRYLTVIDTVSYSRESEKVALIVRGKVFYR